MSISEEELSTRTKLERAEILNQAKRARAIPDILLACRIGGDRHWWASVIDPDYKPAFGRPVVKKCYNCGAVKRTVVSARYGEMLRSWAYEHPEGYKMTKDPASGSTRLRPDAVRLEMGRRQKGKKLPTIADLRSAWEKQHDE